MVVLPATDRPRRWSMMVGTTAVFALLSASCRDPNVYQSPPPPKVTVARPVQQKIVLFHDFTGRIEAMESVEIRPRVSGYLQKVHFEEGKEVNEGDPLFLIDQDQYQTSLSAAQADVSRAAALVEQAKYEHERVSKLVENNAAPDIELINAQANRDRTQAELLAARASLRRAELDIEYTEITAPISGRISRTLVDVGNLVGQGTPTVLATIVKWHPIHVYFTVDERYALAVRRSMAQMSEEAGREYEVYLQLADGEFHPESGVIDYADNQIDPETGTWRLRAVVDNPDSLLIPGIFARVRIPANPREAMFVPESALQRDLSGYFLMTLTDDDVVARIDVEVGELVRDMRVIEAGLDPQNRVIVSGLQRARPGVKVEAEETELPPVVTDMVAATQPS